MELVSGSLTTPSCDDNMIGILFAIVLTMSMTSSLHRILSFQRMSVSLLVVLILQSTWLLKCTMTTLLECKVLCMCIPTAL